MEKTKSLPKRALNAALALVLTAGLLPAVTAAPAQQAYADESETTITITASDLAGKSYYIGSTVATYVLDVDTLNIPISIPNGGNIKFTKDITFGKSAYIALPQKDGIATVIEGPSEGITITVTGSAPFYFMGGYYPELTIRNLSVVGAEGYEGDGIDLQSDSRLCMENVSFKNIDGEGGLRIGGGADSKNILKNVSFDNVGSEDASHGLQISYCTLNQISISNILTTWGSSSAAAECEECEAKFTDCTLEPTGTVSIQSYFGNGTDTGLTITPQEGYSISQYSINGTDQTIPTETTAVGLAGDDYADTAITSVNVQVAAPAATYDASISADAKAYKVGDQITVPVTMKGDSITTAQGMLSYDKEALKLISLTQGAALSGDNLSWKSGNDTFSFYNNEGSLSEGGVVATATFECLKAVDSTKVTLTAVAGGAADSEGITSEVEFTVAEEGVDTPIIAADATVGDVNNSGKINIVDAQIAYDLGAGKYGTDWTAAIPTGWTKASVFYAADVNADDAVNASDALAIQYYVHNGAFGTWE